MATLRITKKGEITNKKKMKRNLKIKKYGHRILTISLIVYLVYINIF